MNINQALDSHPFIIHLKALAKKLAKEKTISLGQALDLVSRDKCFQHWHHLHTTLKNRVSHQPLLSLHRDERGTPLLGKDSSTQEKIYIDVQDHSFLLQEKELCLELIKQKIRQGEKVIVSGTWEPQLLDEIIKVVEKSARQQDLKIVSFNHNDASKPYARSLPGELSPYVITNLCEALFEFSASAHHPWIEKACSFISTLSGILQQTAPSELTFQNIHKYFNVSFVLQWHQSLPRQYQDTFHALLRSIAKQSSKGESLDEEATTELGHIAMQFIKRLTFFKEHDNFYGHRVLENLFDGKDIIIFNSWDAIAGNAEDSSYFFNIYLKNALNTALKNDIHKITPGYIFFHDTCIPKSYVSSAIHCKSVGYKVVYSFSSLHYWHHEETFLNIWQSCRVFVTQSKEQLNNPWLIYRFLRLRPEQMEDVVANCNIKLFMKESVEPQGKCAWDKNHQKLIVFK